MRNSVKKLFITLALLTASVSFLAGCEEKEPPLLGDVHKHADFKVYIHGEAIDFAQQKYMSEPPDKGGNYLNPFFHLHDMEGGIIHQHMSGVKIGEFFTSLGMEFTSECFVLDDGTRYCNDADNTLKMYVNGQRNTQYGEYEFNDLDRILITYGNENEEEIKQQIESVGDESCIQSEKCPERGKPHDESSCVSSSDCIAPIN